MSRSDEFAEGYNRSDDWELGYPNPNRRYTAVTHHGDRDAPEVRKAHFNTFEQAKAYGLSQAWKVLPNPDMSYTEEKDGYSSAIYDRETGNHWGVILHTTKVNGRWRPHRDGDNP